MFIMGIGMMLKPVNEELIDIFSLCFYQFMLIGGWNINDYTWIPIYVIRFITAAYCTRTLEE
jgi:hypothetical protein